MKKVTYLILLLAVCGFAKAQNWQPIVYGTSYNYKVNDADYITNVIKADSVQKVENDSIFYLNRVFRICDTCPNNNYDDYALRNQPQFLMRQMIKKSDSLYIFYDTAIFSIMPHLKFGDIYVFNENLNIYAVISFEGIEPVLGIPDSVKYISLSNGKMIKISKNYGIIQFQDTDSVYTLCGLKNTESYGEQLPSFNDFFEYEVGDVFQRRTTDWFSGEYIDYTQVTSKYTINSKYISGDTIKYAVSGWKLWTHQTEGPLLFEAWQFSSYLTYIDSANHFIHKYPDELIDIDDYDEYDEYGFILNRVEHHKQNNRLVLKSGSFFDRDEWHPFYIEESPYSDLLVRSWGPPDYIEIKYEEGCGYSSGYHDFEWGGSDYFMGKVHDGDTIGSVSPDSDFEQYVQIREEMRKDIQFYPNPVSIGNELHIISDYKIEQYNIYDITGKLIISENYNSPVILIDVYSAGTYIIEFVCDDRILRNYLIVN